LSADNQQATPESIGESPQRLYAEYPRKSRITNEEALLLGILFTDGCVSKKSKNCWRFYLSNTSLEIIRTFRQSMIDVFGLDSRRVRISEKEVNNKPFYKAVVDSAYCGWLLTSKYGTFRTLAYRGRDGRKIYPPTKLPFTSNTKISVLSQFLKAAFSCDGGINLYVGRSKTGYRFLIRNLYLSCDHPQLQIDYQKLLSFFEIGSKILPRDGKVLVRGKRNLQKFRRKVGFLEGVKITQKSTFWHNWEKNKVLDLALSSYGNAKKVLKLDKFLG